ncbi:MAG: IS66 family transposase [Chloroflexota bacterium]|nr:IS66 family transposase [Chloroflexota bacterium]
MMTREAILGVYEQGRKAVVGLVEALLIRLEEQQEQIGVLGERIKALEDRLAKDSHNSSKPPSSDIIPPKPKSLRSKSGKKPGGQAGHAGRTLTLVEEPDLVVVHNPERCSHCGESLSSPAAVGYERRQVLDLPEMKLRSTEHRAESKRCAGCRHITLAAFPAGVDAMVGYGPRIKSLAIYLNQYQLIPFQRVHELLEEVFGCSFSPGSLQLVISRCYEALEGTQEAIKRGVQSSKVAHFDETGLAVGAGRRWLHVAGTSTLTHYAVHPRRGSKAMREIGVLEEFGGVAVHDALYSYGEFPCAHALCNAHHLRELVFLHEQHKQEWAGKLKELLLEIKGAVEQAKQTGDERLGAGDIAGYEARYRALVEEGIRENPPRVSGKPGRHKRTKGGNLADRLLKREEDVLRFMRDFEVPFDNNQAERDIRMVKVRQKVSGCFRTELGAVMFCRIRGYISTARKQGHNALHALQLALLSQPLLLVPAE